MRRLQFIVFAAVTLALASSAAAQSGRVTGTIKDADGKGIKGATVRATNDVGALRIASTTDDKGRFAMIGLRSGAWKIVAEAPNYLPLEGQATVSAGLSPVLALVLQRDLGPMPLTPLVDGIRRTLEHFRKLQSEGRLDTADLA